MRVLAALVVALVGACGPALPVPVVDLSTTDSSSDAAASDLAAPPDVSVPPDATTGAPFSLPVDVDVGFAVAVADLNGDGLADLLTGSGLGQGFHVHIGKGNGQFQSPMVYSLPQTIWAIAALDLDDDGAVDIVVGDIQAGNLKVYLNNGSGSFPSSSTFAALPVEHEQRMAAGDFDDDGFPDLALITNASLGVLMNNGAGGFGALTTVGTGGGNRVYAARLNRDHRADLLVATANGVSVRMAATTPGTFAAPVTYGAVATTGVAIADFDGDGKNDFATNTGAVFLNTGDGTFQPTAALGASGISILAGDFNRDGKVDLLVGDNANHLLRLFLGKGNGTFQAAGTAALMFGGNNVLPSVLAVGDFDGDQRPDIVVGSDGLFEVFILFNAIA